MCIKPETPKTPCTNKRWASSYKFKISREIMKAMAKNNNEAYISVSPFFLIKKIIIEEI